MCQCQVSIQNLVISLKTEDSKLDPVLLTTSILPKNETSEVVCQSILDAISHKETLLTKWREMYMALYLNNEHDIPEAKDLNISKTANYGIIKTDTCYSAQKLARLLKEEIEVKCRAEGMSEDRIQVFKLDCHNHLRNVWICAMN